MRQGEDETTKGWQEVRTKRQGGTKGRAGREIGMKERRAVGRETRGKRGAQNGIKERRAWLEEKQGARCEDRTTGGNEGQGWKRSRGQKVRTERQGATKGRAGKARDEDRTAAEPNHRGKDGTTGDKHRRGGDRQDCGGREGQKNRVQEETTRRGAWRLIGKKTPNQRDSELVSLRAGAVEGPGRVRTVRKEQTNRKGEAKGGEEGTQRAEGAGTKGKGSRRSCGE
uniref:Uncharacterized protein n=1 Tax=Chromera velia CCMP2878 TaxID=1169474 RepID=A0A0G4FNE9_9ALVE|eukprot:Cvel_17847.t1-p1 / transcript=Cvel_17847.t1 / gene=Cvel_17847 / organism=Chromera_velia_CCMP2878 / gene_product=Spore wall protein 2, putative / transcript_product=Spore wall protein 2, putative / location=Cvel_scaffold1447:6839-7781(-) / protein_length=225 / sequence_SO=supercontig / SO=protein_coding / is_pseudo=false